VPPVEDHPVHPSTIQKTNARYGCFNHAPYKSHYYAPDRVYRPNGTFYIVLRKIDYVMSEYCMTAEMGEADSHPLCEGCTWNR